MTSNPCNTNTNKDPINPHVNTVDLQPTQDVNPHTTPNITKATKTDLTKAHPPRDNITSYITTFNETEQIITDIDKLSHSTTIHNKVLPAMNLNGLCKYDNLHQAYLFEHSSKPVNCSHIQVFLKQSACYTVNQDTHQWCRINTNEITNNHTIAFYNDSSINMVPLPPAEPLEFNAFETIARLSLSQNQTDFPKDTNTQTISNTSIYITMT